MILFITLLIVGGIVVIALFINSTLDRLIDKKQRSMDWAPDNDPYYIARRIGIDMERKRRATQKKKVTKETT